MIILIFIFILLLPLIFILIKSIFFYPIPEGMTLFIGAPGSGKTTLCAYFAKKFFRSKKYKDKNIYCNVPILHTKIITRDDMGKFLIEDGIVEIDEGG